jgi:hypothetical protein
MSKPDLRDRTCRAGELVAALLVACAALAISSGATAATHPQLSSAERAFVKAYVQLVPNLNRASAAIVRSVSNAGKDTDAQIVAVFTGLARQWTAATRPLLALKAPAPDAGLFAAITRRVPAVEADLLATAQAGRVHSAPAGTSAGRQLALDFNSLGVAVGRLKKKLGLP